MTMAKLTPDQRATINKVLEKSSMISLLEEFLHSNQIHDISIESIVIKPKAAAAIADFTESINPVDTSQCKPGFEKRDICTLGGKCSKKCVKIPIP
jgi:hypothetical protein